MQDFGSGKVLEENSVNRHNVYRKVNQRQQMFPFVSVFSHPRIAA